MSTFGVHKVCWRALHDADFQATLRERPAEALDDDRLDDEDRRLLLAGAVGELHSRGANAYLLANLMRVGVLGLTKDVYVARMSALATASDQSPQHHQETKGPSTP